MSVPPSHEIVTIAPCEVNIEPGKSLRQQCFDVRIDVFHHEQQFPLETEIDDLEDSATHFLLRLLPSRKPVGTIRCVKSKGQYKLSRLAVLKDYRQFRFGRELVLALHVFVREDAIATQADAAYARVITHSQIPVKAFYTKFGYESEGEEFDEDGAPHQRMMARIPLSNTDLVS